MAQHWVHFGLPGAQSLMQQQTGAAGFCNHHRLTHQQRHTGSGSSVLGSPVVGKARAQQQQHSKEGALVAAGGVNADAAVAGALGVQQGDVGQLALVDVEAGLLPRLAVRHRGIAGRVAGAGVVGEGVLAQGLAIRPAPKRSSQGRLGLGCDLAEHLVCPSLQADVAEFRRACSRHLRGL